MAELFPSYCAFECWSTTPVLLNVETITVGNNKCNEENDRIDLSKYFNVKNVSIGNYCFKYQEVLNMTDLHTLERVSIGSNSFRKSSDRNSSRALYVKNCEELKELRMGPYSFSDYSVIEIENVDKLEVIEFGELNEESHNFYYASLELKSGWLIMMLMNRLTEFEITSPWWKVIPIFYSFRSRE